MPLPPKSIFKSRTAVLAILTAAAGLCGAHSETVSAFLRNNAEAVLIVLGVLNFALRRLTSDRVEIFPDPPRPPHPGIY